MSQSIREKAQKLLERLTETEKLQLAHKHKKYILCTESISVVFCALVGLAITILFPILNIAESIPPVGWFCYILIIVACTVGVIVISVDLRRTLKKTIDELATQAIIAKLKMRGSFSLPQKTSGGSKQSAAIVSDRGILAFFFHNKSLLHGIFVPLFNFAIWKGISPATIAQITNEAYNIAYQQANNLTNLGDILTRQTSQIWSDIIRKQRDGFRGDYARYFTDNLIEANLNSQFLYSDFQHSILNSPSQNEGTSCAVRLYLKSQIKLALLKLFIYKKEISGIAKSKPELYKILINATHKYQIPTVIAGNTYDLFLDYYGVTKYRLPLEIYNEFIWIFYSKRKACSDFYKAEEMAFDFDIHSFSLDEIAKKIIDARLYQKYDTERLLVGILYEKAKDFKSLLDFISELNSIKNKCEIIHKAQTKEDLLNYKHTDQRISIGNIDLMSGVEFEDYLCDYFNAHGYQCTTTKASGDQGIDLIAKKGDVVLAIQAKCYAGVVGNHAVMEAVAGTKYYNANQTMVITNSTFTKSAIELAKANDVVLWDRQVLIEKLTESYPSSTVGKYEI